jgi:hypothetical protein
MPQRSNLYQKLVLLVHESLIPDWEVTESEMLTDLVTGMAREVDIVAKRNIMGHQLVLSVECRDQSRPASVTWVETLSKKHEHLSTSKLVLWSRNGFTRQALLKAKALKIDTMSEEQATIPMWAKLAHDLVGGHVLHVAPSYKPFIDVVMPDGSLKRYESVENWKFFDANGVEAGSVAELIQYVSHSKDTGTVLLDHAPLGSGSFWFQFVPPASLFADIPEGPRCRAHRIGAGIETVSEKSTFQLASALAEKSVITLASAALTSGNLELVIEEDERGPRRINSCFSPRKS